ncbi:hypothetical protein PSHT_02604 [Puccinia striiformis]|uniref:Uncharacterized protein n=1 Tax=Puccinia striiformis TaxID=27350 RepID=A0A2S4WHK6_9BASI|nr:hypothetical protein PSHT_02604 [Puccinia striiformis]
MLMLGNLYLCDRTSITTYQPKAGSSHLNKLIWLTKEQIRKASEKHDKIELVREIEIDSRTDNQASFCSVPLQLLSSLKLTTIPVKISGDCVHKITRLNGLSSSSLKLGAEIGSSSGTRVEATAGIANQNKMTITGLSNRLNPQQQQPKSHRNEGAINFQPTLHTIYTDKLVNQNLAGHDGLRENLSGGQ